MCLASSVSQHHCLKTDLMSGLKRISSVLMNMVGWTIYRALMFFLYLEKKREEAETFLLAGLYKSFPPTQSICVLGRSFCQILTAAAGQRKASRATDGDTRASLTNTVRLLLVTHGGDVPSDRMQTAG